MVGRGAAGHAVMIAGGLVLLLTGCGANGPGANPASAAEVVPQQTIDQSTASPSTSGPCPLKSTEDLILWQHVPGMPANAQIVGNVNSDLCKPTAESLQQMAPLIAGSCTAVARTKDNPDYLLNAFPAQKPKKILAQYGDGC